jgi:ribosomal protein S18
MCTLCTGKIKSILYLFKDIDSLQVYMYEHDCCIPRQKTGEMQQRKYSLQSVLFDLKVPIE